METDNLKPIRKIVHVGADCFYAAVMMRYEPSLQGKPVVAVYGDSSKREVICSPNYEAREFGIHAGMKTKPFGYLIKPFENKELNSTIEMALYKHKAEKDRNKLIKDL